MAMRCATLLSLWSSPAGASLADHQSVAEQLGYQVGATAAKLAQLIEQTGWIDQATKDRPLGGQGEFLGGDRDDALGRDVSLAMEQLLGSGGAAAAGVEEVEGAIAAMWATLPKDQHGRAAWSTVRYVAHRHLYRRSGIVVRGLEPHPERQAAHWSEILGSDAPAGMLDLAIANGGFSLRDTATVIVSMERLLLDSNRRLLRLADRLVNANEGGSLPPTRVVILLKVYMIFWIFGTQGESIEAIFDNPHGPNEEVIGEMMPQWLEIGVWLEGQVSAFHFRRSKQHGLSSGQDIMSNHYSFDDAFHIVVGVTRDFHTYWTGECAMMKDKLLLLDREGTGRVRLVDFYGTGKEEDWRFGESEAYLRDLGALDETSSSRGAQVMVPSYMQAASNCVISTDHYLVCCQNECEDLRAGIETAIGGPSATAGQLLEVVRGMGAQPSGELVALLTRIAAHGLVRPSDGLVPLHGRLFSQWLHYVFPQDCIYPYTTTGPSSSSLRTLTVGAYGEDKAIASEQDVEKWQAIGREERRFAATGTAFAEDWMERWSPEEELFADYERAARGRAAQQERVKDSALMNAAIGAASLVAVGLVAMVAETRGEPTPSAKRLAGFPGKRHLV